MPFVQVSHPLSAHVSWSCARRVLGAVALVASVASNIGCGSSSNPTAPTAAVSPPVAATPTTTPTATSTTPTALAPLTPAQFEMLGGAIQDE